MPRVSDAYREQRRKQILDAAVRCFARQGFHRTSMQDIVGEAALSPGALYRYFASKEDLIAAIASERHAAELAMLREAAEGSDAAGGLQRLARELLGRLASPDEQAWRRVTVQLWGEALRSPRVMEVVREGLDAPLALLGAWLRRARDEGRVPADLDPEAAARVAAAIFQGLVLQQAWDPGVDVAAAARAIETALDALLVTRGSPPPV
jgi:AcrR family transcriptional regulator